MCKSARYSGENNMGKQETGKDREKGNSVKN